MIHGCRQIEKRSVFFIELTFPQFEILFIFSKKSAGDGAQYKCTSK